MPEKPDNTVKQEWLM